MKTRRCSSCKEELPINKFGAKGKDRLQSLCKSCLYAYQTKRWNAKKIAAIVYLGGKCQDCGVKVHPAVMDFHHRGEDTKEFEWFKLRLRSWGNIVSELNKCDLLCSNCHRLRHTRADLWEGLEHLVSKYVEEMAPLV